MGKRTRHPGTGTTHDLEQRATDVAEGRTHASLDELLVLIHAVNPTGHALPRAEEARRYALKNRLQCRLLREHGPLLHVVPHPDDPQLVSIQRRSLSGDACHARVEELEEDVRSWVRHQLDVRAWEEPEEQSPASRGKSAAAPPPATQTRDGDELHSVADYLISGLHALEEYDYEAARSHLGAAFTRSGGNAETALRYLGFLVDTVADDAAVLDAEKSLSADAARHPEVRALLAISAARAGQTEQAAQLITGVESERVPEVLVLLAQHALSRDDLSAAAAWLGRMRREALAHPELPALEVRLGAMRAEQRAQWEARLREMHHQGHPECEQQAQALLASFPDSRVAREVVESFGEQRHHQQEAARKAQAREVLAEAQQAIQRGELERARRLLSEVLSLDATLTPAQGAMAQVEQHLQARREQQALQEALAAVEGPDVRKGLYAYLALTPQVARHVQQRHPSTLLKWLDEVPPDVRMAKPWETVEAVLALEQAHAAMQQGQAEEVLRLLQPYESVMQNHPLAAQVRTTARAALQEARHQSARRGLMQLEQAVAERQVDQAPALLQGLDVEALDHAERQRVESLRRELAAQSAHAERVALHEQACEQQQWIEARNHAAWLMEHGLPAERERWAQTTQEHRQTIRGRWRIRVDNLSPPLPANFPDAMLAFSRQEGVDVWLTPDGTGLLLANVYGRWLFIRRLDVTTGTVVQQVSMRVPEPLEYIHWVVDAQHLWVISDDWLLQLSLAEFDALQWRSMKGFAGADEYVESICPLPGTRYVWLGLQRKPEHAGSPVIGRSVVVNTDSWNVVRHGPSDGHLALVPWPGGPQVFFPVERTTNLRLYHPSGHAERIGSTKNKKPIDVTIHPSGHGSLWVCRHEDREDDWVVLEYLTGAASPAQRFDLPHLHEDDSVALATSVRRGVSLLIQHIKGRPGAILSGHPLTMSTPVSISGPVLLAADTQCQDTVALGRTEDGVVLLRLDQVAQWPQLHPDFRPATAFSLEPETMSCRLVDMDENSPERVVAEGFWNTPPAKHLEVTEQLCRQFADSPVALTFLAGISGFHKLIAVVEPAVRALLRKHPAQPLALLAAAHLSALQNRWDEAWDPLMQIHESDQLGGKSRCHFHHLRALIHLHRGETEQAWKEALLGHTANPEGCELEALVQLTRPVCLEDGEEGSTSVPALYALRLMAGLADDRLKEGGWKEVVDTLDWRTVHEAEELQTLGRLAQGYLGLSDPNRRFNKSIALASFLKAMESKQQRNLPLGHLQWGKEKLEQVAQRARAWLENEGS